MSSYQKKMEPRDTVDELLDGRKKHELRYYAHLVHLPGLSIIEKRLTAKVNQTDYR